MECDSIMDISSVNLNLEELSSLNEVSMEMTTPLTPAREISMAIQEPEESLEDFEMPNETNQLSSLPTLTATVNTKLEERNREPFNPKANLKQALSIVPDTKAIIDRTKRNLHGKLIGGILVYCNIHCFFYQLIVTSRALLK